MSKGGQRITAELVERFGEMVRAALRGKDERLRKADVELLVDEVRVSESEIRISGSSSALELAVGTPAHRIEALMPIFDREWCPGKELVNSIHS